MSAPLAYVALGLQTTCVAVNHTADPRRCMLDACVRIEQTILAAKRFIGADVRLVVLPEYVLTGFPMGDSAVEWTRKAAISPGGAEYAALGRIALAADIYLAGNAYETDEHFPNLNFQTSFILDPKGMVILRYRRLISLFSPSPYDVWERYRQIYGEAALFPVVDTPIGRLAAIASEEILYPEIARALALRGAEVFVHSSSEIASALPSPKNIAKQARAIENTAYVISANTAGIEGIAIPKASVDGNSQVVDYRGLILAQAQGGESMAAHAELDLDASRRYRRRSGMGNMLSRQPIALWRQALQVPDIQLPNSLLQTDGTPSPTPAANFYSARQRQAIERLVEQKIIV